MGLLSDRRWVRQKGRWLALQLAQLWDPNWDPQLACHSGRNSAMGSQTARRWVQVTQSVQRWGPPKAQQWVPQLVLLLDPPKVQRLGLRLVQQWDQSWALRKDQP